jgi:organic hydroperoxide reductase OsmC/OhrA
MNCVICKTRDTRPGTVTVTLQRGETTLLIKEAHEQICPYSHATRNNVAVDFVVKGG